jgi:hypothetical protein
MRYEDWGYGICVESCWKMGVGSKGVKEVKEEFEWIKIKYTHSGDT